MRSSSASRCGQWHHSTPPGLQHHHAAQLLGVGVQAVCRGKAGLRCHALVGWHGLWEVKGLDVAHHCSGLSLVNDAWRQRRQGWGRAGFGSAWPTRSVQQQQMRTQGHAGSSRAGAEARHKLAGCCRLVRRATARKTDSYTQLCQARDSKQTSKHPPACTASCMCAPNRSRNCARSSSSFKKMSTRIKAPPGRRQRAACCRKRALPSRLH